MNSCGTVPADQHHLHVANNSYCKCVPENCSAETAFCSFPCSNENSFSVPIKEDEERFLEEEGIDSLPPLHPSSFENLTNSPLARECIRDEVDSCGLTPSNNDDSTDPIVTLMSCASPNFDSSQKMYDCVLRCLPNVQWNADPITDALVRKSIRTQKQWENVQALFFSDRFPLSLPSPPLALTWHGMPAMDGFTAPGKRKREECNLENESDEEICALRLPKRKAVNLLGQHSENLSLNQPHTSIRKIDWVRKEGAAWSKCCMYDDYLRHNGSTKLCSLSYGDEKIDSFSSLMDSQDGSDGAKVSGAAEGRKDGRQCIARNMAVELLGKKRYREDPVVEMVSFGRKMKK